MAVTEVSGVRHYAGLSSDDKPTDGVPSGSTFLEITVGTPNTARRWLFDGVHWGQNADGGGDIVDSNLLVPRVVTGEAVLDEGEADWSAATDLIVITPAADAPLRDAYLDIDLAKATTGFAAGYAAQTLTLQVARKVDGTNWHAEAAQTAISGTNAAGRIIRLALGMVGEDEEVKVTAKLSAENGGSVVAEMPYALSYLATLAPTITAAEAGA